jgi:hypothetical protein
MDEKKNITVVVGLLIVIATAYLSSAWLFYFSTVEGRESLILQYEDYDEKSARWI